MKWQLFLIRFSICYLLVFAQDAFGQMLGRHVAEIEHVERKNEIDSRISVVYSWNSMVSTNYVAFDDTVVFSQSWDETEWFMGGGGEDSRVKLSEVSDEGRLLGLQEYFQEKYGLRLRVEDGARGIADIKVRFGLKCGASALPVGAGKLYLKLRDQGIGNEEMLALLASINPMKQLVGYLLLAEGNRYSPYMERIRQSNYVVMYCYGCGGSRRVPMSQVIQSFEK